MYDDDQSRPDLSHVEFFRIYRGRVHETVTALTDELYAVAPQLDDDEDPRGIHKHGPLLGWDRRSDGSYPQAGDDVALYLDDTGDFWCAGWSPA